MCVCVLYEYMKPRVPCVKCSTGTTDSIVLLFVQPHFDTHTSRDAIDVGGEMVAPHMNYAYQSVAATRSAPPSGMCDNYCATVLCNSVISCVESVLR